MTTLDITTSTPNVPAERGSTLGTRLAANWRQHRAERATFRRLQQLDARILADMGFEPAEIYASRVGTWREEHGEAWKGLK